MGDNYDLATKCAVCASTWRRLCGAPLAKAAQAAKLATAAEAVPALPVRCRAEGQGERDRAKVRPEEAAAAKAERRRRPSERKKGTRGGQMTAKEEGTSGFCIRLHDPGSQAEREGGKSGIMKSESRTELARSAGIVPTLLARTSGKFVRSFHEDVKQFTGIDRRKSLTGPKPSLGAAA